MTEMQSGHIILFSKKYLYIAPQTYFSSVKKPFGVNSRNQVDISPCTKIKASNGAGSYNYQPNKITMFHPTAHINLNHTYHSNVVFVRYIAR